MNRSLRLAARGLLLALTLTAPLGALPTSGEDAKAFLWTGVRGNIGRTPRLDVEVTSYGNGTPDEIRRVRPDEHVSRLRTELAELRLTEATEGPSAENVAARLELWIRACDDEAFAGQGELLVELALERAESLAARGDSEAAFAATQELLVPARLAAQAGEFELREADAAWLERAAAWLADPALVAFRAKLAPPQAAPAASSDMEAVIVQNLAAGQGAVVMQFGSRAVPVTEAFVAQRLGEYPISGNTDPLTILFELDEERGARFALERLDGSGDVFPLRVLRSMRSANVLEDSDTWRISEGEVVDDQWRFSTELRQTIWRDILERLIANDGVAWDACREVSLLVRMDALSPGLADFLERAVRGEDPTLHQKALMALEDAYGRASARGLLARLLDHPSAEMRAFAAQRLSVFDECRELWPLAEDPAVKVRLKVLDGLRPWQARVLSLRGPGNVDLQMTKRFTLRGLDQGGLAVLERLLRDGESEVYLGALEILLGQRGRAPELALPMQTLLGMTGHRDPQVRVLLARLRAGGLPVPEILEVLAADSDPNVLRELDGALSELSAIGPLPNNEIVLKPGWRVLITVSTPWSDAFLPALLRRLEPLSGIPEALAQAELVHLAGLSSRGARELTELGIASASVELRRQLVQALARQRNWSQRRTPLHFVEPERVRELLRLAWEVAPDDPTWTIALASLLLGPEGHRTAALDWSSQAELPWAVRYLGLSASVSLADDAWRGRLLALLAEPSPLSSADAQGWVGTLFELGKRLGNREQAERLLADLVVSESVSDEALSRLVSGLIHNAGPDPVTAVRALERWLAQSPRFEGLLVQALGRVPATEEQPELDLFERILRSDDDDIVEPALQSLGRLRLRAHLPLLERALAGEFSANEDLRSVHQARAAEALACYLDDEAAEILLRGVGMTTDPSVRDICFAALETIRRYQDERARWNSRADAGRARAEAIAELVGLIETGEPAQKVEAVRALGTLEALEELPRLVRLAGARDAALAKAAKEALERIHAAGKQD